ncbi:MW1434 family type I TA system toxin [Xenorhabdus bovienii]|uniref:Uncharacterized protein n=1 Tax=Xenorhabdus bovienii str. feltiae Moldova TaxID=1398200 RepID=A0A077NEK1_XENBV|nr:MW1434 family type I TA system toxin [Xenorhabdus bovienii]CDH00632.1 conserved hypothetical protein [Xenorhabdus bovienii str. feltiae Moldova]
MSDVNKPENKNSKTQCQINPDQYKIKIDTVTAPIGSCPWAIIQVYLGNKLHRSDWDTPNEHMRLTSKKPGNDSVYIEKSDKHGTWFPWQPTPEDLMACDWGLVKQCVKLACPEGTMLSFDLTLGTGHLEVIDQGWGYMTVEGHDYSGDATFGTLTSFQSNVNITNIVSFIFYREFISLKVSSNTDDSQKMMGFLTKHLYVTVDNKTYILDYDSVGNATGSHVYRLAYVNSDVQKLGEILKQTGQTKTFCFNWK